MKLTINSDLSLSKAIGEIRGLYMQFRYLRLSIKTGKDRSLDQNAQAWVWYGQIARELREQTPDEIHNECKLTIGVPILRAEDEEFREFSNLALRPLTYEQRLKAMDYVPVTSIMTTNQLSRYLETMQQRYAGRGVILNFSEQ